MPATPLLGPTLGLFTTAPHAHGPFSVVRKSMQGAGAGYIGLDGAGAFGRALTAPDATPVVPVSSFEGLIGAVVSGAYNAQLQVLAAVLIFFAAGRCVARMFGLGVVILGYVAYMQGMRWDDVADLLQNFGLRLGAAARAFMQSPDGGA